MGLKETFYIKDQAYYRHSWFQLLRPLTLTGTMSPIIAGTILASYKGNIEIKYFLAVLVASLLVQMSVNILNDYFDFQNGQDQEKWVDDDGLKKGPAHSSLPFMAGTMLLIAMTMGTWLAWHNGFWLIAIGTVSILFGIGYSAGSRSLSARGLGELVAFIFLGFVVTTIAYVVQVHRLDVQIIAVAVPFAILISIMILSNNIRDIEKDQGFRHTLVMIIGRKKGTQLLSILLAIPYLWTIGLASFHVIPWASIMALFALPLAIKLRYSYRKGANRSEEIKGMKWASWHHWVFSLLFIIGMMWPLI